MKEGGRHPRPKQKQLIVAVAILASVGFGLFLFLLSGAHSPSAPGAVDSGSYADELALALTGADSTIGERLIAETDCAACHLTGEGRMAPLFNGLASVADARRPPLNAEQYLYEAIVFPAAHLVDGYANAMPNDYAQRFSPADLGHMIAYLLTLTD